MLGPRLRSPLERRRPRRGTRRRTAAVGAALVVAAAVGCGSDGSESAAGRTVTGSELAPASFVDLQDVEVTIDGATTPLGASSLTYVRRGPEGFDDPDTPTFEGISGALRAFLACQQDTWSVGGQTLIVDLITRGVTEDDRALVDKGVVGVEWGAGLGLTDEGIHTLTRTCDGATETVETLGGTHTGTQWLESMGRAVWLLRAADPDEEYAAEIDRTITRIEELAADLVDPQNQRVWEETWLTDAAGNIFTHKTWMRAAGLALAATLTDDRPAAEEWAAEAERIAREGLSAQRDDGVNPERGGHDVTYQMYGTWLATLYDSTLAPGPLKVDVEAMIDRSVEWFSGRVDPTTGQVDITGSTRTCNAGDGSSPYEAPDAVRVFLAWGAMHPDRPELIDQAVLIDQGAVSPGNPCS